ncbi:MAG: YitT family protein [Firmicutes bacterium]|nr:YitT family protein [Bacillota bacterium]
MDQKRKPWVDKSGYPFRKHVRNLFYLTVASLICCAGYVMFIGPNRLLAGGVWGIAGLLNHFIPQAPMGVFLVLFNVPLLIWGWKELKTRFAVYTIYVILLQSVLLSVLVPYIPVYADNILLACLFGGAITGVGGGLVVRWHGSGGGADIVGILLKEKYDFSIGSIAFAVNAVVVSMAAWVYGFELAMYTIVELFVCSMVFNRVLEGVNLKRNVMIISDRGEEIAHRLMKEVGRGATLLPGEGAYTHTSKDVLFCVVGRYELSALKEIIREVDADAFVCISDVYEVMGRFSRHVLEENAAQAQLLRQGLAEKNDPGDIYRP